MGTTAFLFPGQGSQTASMGRQFYDEWPEFRSAFDRFDDAAEIDLAACVFEGSDDQLRRTDYTQPAVLAVGGAAAIAVRERYDVVPDVVAGHSLGHFTALLAAGALGERDAIDLVSARGRLMQRAGEANGPGTMVAALLVDPDDVAAVCADYDDVSVAVYNGPRQTVVSGASEQVEAVKRDLEADGSVRFTELDVGTAFHSPLMASAVDEFTALLEETAFDDPAVPVVSDVSAERYDSAAVPVTDLSDQLTSPVRWTDVVETLDRDGATRYVEFPPAGTLSTLVERIGVDGAVHELGGPDDAPEVFSDA